MVLGSSPLINRANTMARHNDVSQVFKEFDVVPEDTVPAGTGNRARSISSEGKVFNTNLEPALTDASTETPEEFKAMETGGEQSTEPEVKFEEPGPIQVERPNIPIEIEKEGK